MNRHRRTYATAGCAAALLVAGAPGAWAHTIYACSSNGGLFGIDVDNNLAITTYRSNTSGYDAYSIAAGDLPGTLFVQKWWMGAVERFDLGSLQSTPTGAQLFGLAFGEGMDGFWYSNESGPNALDRVQPGSATFVPQFLGNGAYAFAGDIAADAAGVLYGTNMNHELVTLSKTTGAQQVVISNTPTLYGLAFTSDGRLFAGAPSGMVYQVTGGALVPVGNVGFSIYDLASERSIPEPASLALVGLSSAAALRRRR